jgi:hypothetical protein
MDELAPARSHLHVQGARLRATRRLRSETLAPVFGAHASSRPRPQDGDRFWRMAMCYVRGNTIKYLRVPEVVRSARALRFRARPRACCRRLGTHASRARPCL